MQYGASIAYWMATARTLREARAICPHGQWQAFLAKAGIPERTGRNMLRLADFKTETVAVLGGIKATLADIEQARHFEERAAALATGKRERRRVAQVVSGNACHVGSRDSGTTRVD